MGNITSNAVLEYIYLDLGNLVQTCNTKDTYIDEDDLWMVILMTAEFLICFKTNRFKGYSMGQILFGRDMILTIKKTADWE